ncbi:MAG TPA: glycoside hydrolase family 31 protein [Candidatus Hydrogenedentes bacterium]|nr:glycoside hydrolase family 31 protein [Candidatus Hydrogenedentota bacterium]
MFNVIALILALAGAVEESSAPRTVSELGNGVWQIRFGTPEAFTPNVFRECEPRWEALDRLPKDALIPFDLNGITGDIRASRTVVSIPCDEPDSHIYGFGLDPGAFDQKGLRKWLSVCASVVGKTGASHGPVPFYVSTRGYGIYVDTARVPFVHVARLARKDAPAREPSADQAALSTSEKELYAACKAQGTRQVVFDIPGNTSGIDVYVFAGPTVREAVQRFNLFAGGGCMPPLWGLGLKYRTHSNAMEEEVLRLAKSFREMKIPCDMFGLEPGWQTHAYSCSLAWSGERFPHHQAMVDQLWGMNFRVNLWEHAYIHPTSPLFAPLKDHSGEYLVWEGLVVDFPDPAASKLFADYHENELINKGISAFKADECDRQFIDDTTPFNYPYFTKFPSGIDGDQMTQLYGYLYQRSILSAFKKKGLRTWGDVRATTALAAPLPFNLYSDAYEFDQYLRQLVNASFCGLLWSPEVREAGTREETLNRIGMSSLAPQMCLNIWFMPHPIWEQYNRAKNEKHDLLPKEEQQAMAGRIRDIANLRMSLLPYLYACFFRYREEGLPPVRALVLEFPNDPGVYFIDDQYMYGDALMAAPFLRAAHERSVYFPADCAWIDFRTNKKYPGGTKQTVQGDPGDVPLFVKENSLLPVATPVERVARDTIFDLTVCVYGDTPAPMALIEDDGETYNYERGQFNRVILAWEKGKIMVTREGNFPETRYRINAWKKIQGE